MGYDVGILHDLVGVGAHADPAFTPQCLRRPGYPLTYLKILAFFVIGRRNRIQFATNFGLRHPAGVLPEFCIASQKAGHFPCGKSLVLPRAPADISAQRKFVNLARKQRARDKSILLFRLRRKAVTLGELGR